MDVQRNGAAGARCWRACSASNSQSRTLSLFVSNIIKYSLFFFIACRYDLMLCVYEYLLIVQHLVQLEQGQLLVCVIFKMFILTYF